MSRFQKALGSSIGRKMTVALTGLGLVGFVLAHMAGNLQVFAGREKLNAYAQGLKDLGPLLWVARIGLLLMFVTHMAFAFRLWRENSAARSQKYAVVSYETATFASRSMILTGSLVLAFALFHLAHFTFQWTHPEMASLHDAKGRHDVYAMVVQGFRSAPVSVGYVVAQVALGLHLSHGVSSVLQTLGFTSPRLAPLKTFAGPAVAALVVLGNCAIPLAILTGAVGADVPAAGRGN